MVGPGVDMVGRVYGGFHSIGVDECGEERIGDGELLVF